MPFLLFIESRALRDIQKAINYYNNQQKGLGKKFENEVDKYFQSLEKNPFFQIRYDFINCLPMKKFPFMIHFSVDKKSEFVYIHAVLHTSLNPEDYWIQTK